jgi:hypothetical protein
MEGREMYITLPSNTADSDGIFKDNTLASYKTHLATAIHMNKHENYEVALTEIILNGHIFNIFKAEIAFTISREKDHYLRLTGLDLHKQSPVLWSVYSDNKSYFSESFSFIPDYYANIGELLYSFNTQLKKSKICTDLGFKLKGGNGDKVKIALCSNASDNLNKTQKFVFKSGIKWNTAISEIASEGSGSDIYFLCSLRKLFVSPGACIAYTDIVEYSFIGNTTAKVLRIINFPQDQPHTSLTFNPPQYLPLSESTLSTIEITFKDSSGVNYPFFAGLLTSVLHLRKCNNE